MDSSDLCSEVTFHQLPEDVTPKNLPIDLVLLITEIELKRGKLYLYSQNTTGWYIICNGEKLLVGVLGNWSGVLYLVAFSEKYGYIVTDGSKTMIVSKSKPASSPEPTLPSEPALPSDPASTPEPDLSSKPWVVEGRKPWFHAYCKSSTEAVERAINELERDRANQIGLLAVQLTQVPTMSPVASPVASPAASSAIESDADGWTPLDLWMD